MNEEVEDSTEGLIEEPAKKKNNFSLVLLFIVIFIAIVGIFIFVSKKQSTEKGNTLSTEIEKTYNMEEIATHNKKEDCWLVIETYVYDITDFVSKHPGGEIILTACGTDATAKFNNRPTTGTSHSSLARKMLQSLRLGSLSE